MIIDKHLSTLLISILLEKTLYMSDIICSETILYRQKGNLVTTSHLVLNKACKDAILTKNDDVIYLKFWS